MLDEILDAPIPCNVLARAAMLVGVEDNGRGMNLRATHKIGGATHRIDVRDGTLAPEASTDLRPTIACFERWASNR